MLSHWGIQNYSATNSIKYSTLAVPRQPFKQPTRCKQQELHSLPLIVYQESRVVTAACIDTAASTAVVSSVNVVSHSHLVHRSDVCPLCPQCLTMQAINASSHAIRMSSITAKTIYRKGQQVILDGDNLGYKLQWEND